MTTLVRVAVTTDDATGSWIPSEQVQIWADILEGGDDCFTAQILDWQLQPVFDEVFCPPAGEATSLTVSQLPLLATSIDPQPSSTGCAISGPAPRPGTWLPLLGLLMVRLVRRAPVTPRTGRRSRGRFSTSCRR